VPPPQIAFLHEQQPLVGAAISGVYVPRAGGPAHELQALMNDDGGPVYVLPPGTIQRPRAVKGGVEVRAQTDVEVPPVPCEGDQPVPRRVITKDSGFAAVVDRAAEGLTVVLADVSGSMGGRGMRVCHR
jgi:hypothetical protein